MKMKVIALVALFALLALSFGGTAVLAADLSNTTEATVGFKEGDIEFIDDLDAGMNNMDLDFGVNELPTAAVTYYAGATGSGSHTLRVSDARAVAGDWEVGVKMSKFEMSSDSTKTFEGTVTLNNGTAASVLGRNTPGAGNDFYVVDAQIVIVSEAMAAVGVMEANGNLKNDSFDASWSKDEISLDLNNTNAALVELAAGGADSTYIADMTWTLTIQ